MDNKSEQTKIAEHELRITSLEKSVSVIYEVRDIVMKLNDRINQPGMLQCPVRQIKLDEHDKRLQLVEATTEDYNQNKWTYKGIVITVSTIMLIIQIFGGYVSDKYFKNDTTTPQSVKIELIYPTNFPLLINTNNIK
jgi:hypothetical protein